MDVWKCPAGEWVIRRFVERQHGRSIYRYWSTERHDAGAPDQGWKARPLPSTLTGHPLGDKSLRSRGRSAARFTAKRRANRKAQKPRGSAWTAVSTL